MKLGIMQPYLFPYIGYYQLISAVDKFVIYDDVAFIKQGWLNRNNLLVNGQATPFSVPVSNLSSFRLICDTEADPGKYSFWRKKFMKTLEFAYKKAPHFDTVYDLVQSVFPDEVKGKVLIRDMAAASIKSVVSYLEIPTVIVDSSRQYHNADLKGKDRVIDICRKEAASVYVNASGGKELYSRGDFESAGLTLRFIKHHIAEYKQFSGTFVPSLSVIDTLMFNSIEECRGLLNQYQLE